jgi:serine phosphatase RsbU (regulator of sigma subunit)
MQSLIVIKGTKHYPYELEEGSVAIGQGEGNDIVLDDDPEVSGTHCQVLLNSDKRWILRDEGSTNGTYLNDTLVRKATLQSGDKLRVGQTVILFVDRSRGSNKGEHSRLQNLLILQEINKALNSETDLGRLLELIMEMAIHLTHAQRGFLVLVKGEQLTFKVARNIDYGAVKSPEFKISNSVIRRVVKTGQPMLTSNAQADLSSFQSIVNQDVRSLLCVPLRIKKKILGTLYVDSQQRAVSFSEHDKELLAAFSDQAAIAMENARLLKETMEAEAIRSELRVASRIQLALLPREDPFVPGLEISGRMITAKEVGGDYYDYMSPPVEPGQKSEDLFVAIGDVSGKGVPAGLVMVMARSVLRSLASSWDAPPCELMTEVNRILKPDLKPGMFMSMLLGRYSVDRGTFVLTGCGHERPLVFRADKRDVQAFDAGGIVLGVVADIGPMLADIEIELAIGDQLLLYTDGVTEAMNEAGEQYGIQRLMHMFSSFGHSSAPDLVDTILADIERHRGQAERNDDITLIALARREKR